jgi:YHS domain-containing protein
MLKTSNSIQSLKQVINKITHHDKSVTSFSIEDNPKLLKNLCYLDSCKNSNGEKRYAKEGYKYDNKDYFFCSPIHAGQFFNDLEHNLNGLNITSLDEATKSNISPHSIHNHEDDNNNIEKKNLSRNVTFKQ